LGKLFADRGYISEKLFNHLFFDGIHLITTVIKKYAAEVYDCQ